MKKFVLYILLFACSCYSHARTWYVSASGNDVANGLTPATAWRTLTKLNASMVLFAAGDTIAFRRGDKFYGVLVIGKSGTKQKPIIVTSYGVGSPAVISGFKEITGFTATGGGIFNAPAAGAKNNLILVTINGIPQQIGRYPNKNAADGGFLRYQSSTAQTNITDTVNAIGDWKGSTIVVHPNAYINEPNIVTGVVGKTITFRMGRTINSGVTPEFFDKRPNHGYFFQNHIRTLDQFGEWFLDTVSKKLNIYFGSADPSSYQVKVATVDTLVRCGASQFLKFVSLDFEGGNMSGIHAMNTSDISFIDCGFIDFGGKAIHLTNVPNTLITNCRTNYILNNAIQVLNRTADNVTITNCVLKNTAPYIGMDSYYDGTNANAIYVSVAKNATVRNNFIDTVGRVAIYFRGNSLLIKNNVINYYMYRYGDQGGIYGWVAGTDAAPSEYFTDRTIDGNILMNGLGDPSGTPADTATTGIYLDGRTMNVNVINNTIFNSAKNGVHTNNCWGVTIKNNLFWNCKRSISFMRWAWGSIKNLRIVGNTIFNTNKNYYAYYYTDAAMPVDSLAARVARFYCDSNYISNYAPAGFIIEAYQYENGPAVLIPPTSFGLWKQLTGGDQNTKIIYQVREYKILTNMGVNLVANGDFTSNVSGWSIFGNGSPAVTWLSGKARITVASPLVNRYTQFHRPIGPVSTAKSYRATITTKGSSFSTFKCYLRKTTSPNNDLVSRQVRAFDTALQVHEFLFTSPISEAAASIVFDFEQSGGPVEIDNIRLEEVTASTWRVEDSVLLKSNAALNAVTYLLPGKYITPKNSIVDKAVDVASFDTFLGLRYGQSESPTPAGPANRPTLMRGIKLLPKQ